MYFQGLIYCGISIKMISSHLSVYQNGLEKSSSLKAQNVKWFLIIICDSIAHACNLRCNTYLTLTPCVGEEIYIYQSSHKWLKRLKPISIKARIFGFFFVYMIDEIHLLVNWVYSYRFLKIKLAHFFLVGVKELDFAFSSLNGKRRWNERMFTANIIALQQNDKEIKTIFFQKRCRNTWKWVEAYLSLLLVYFLSEIIYN